ncbi:MAG TPA: 3-phosphoshikimate 1-carboxyvinyltransferase, partial [Pseudomonas sp.]|nr:3-phosphoshikimate 1-carboxyvinyltransferase [Pseudomonas sp.]
IAKAALATLFLLFSALVGLVILYLLKSALGINLFPDFSLGLWDWFKESL